MLIRVSRYLRKVKPNYLSGHPYVYEQRTQTAARHQEPRLAIHHRDGTRKRWALDCGNTTGSRRISLRSHPRRSELTESNAKQELSSQGWSCGWCLSETGGSNFSLPIIYFADLFAKCAPSRFQGMGASTHTRAEALHGKPPSELFQAEIHRL